MLLKKNLCNISLVVVLLFVFVVAGIFCFNAKKDLVAFRLGVEKRYIDYDLDMALNVLKDKFEKKGYKVGEFAYSGNLYPKELDKAKINVFVRGFQPFYDKRLADDAVNVLYVHRAENLVKQEMDRFDYYLSSQMSMIDRFKEKNNIDYFGADNVKREYLKNGYECDVLYIYEYRTNFYADFLRSGSKNILMSGSGFYVLSDEEKIKTLEGCKVVVYDAGITGIDDDDYISYAVYDIMSYGRPVITNYNEKLEKEFDGILMFKNVEDMVVKTIEALNMSDEKRENKALLFKKILDENEADYSFIDKYAKKNKNISGYLDNIN